MPTIDLCAAVDRQKKGCCLPRKLGTRWCERHNQERIKLYLGYKLDHKALESFPKDCICLNLEKVRLGSAAEVKKWNEAIRIKCNLLNRCIDARARFSERFFGNDMDFGHKVIHTKLRTEREELEICLIAVERRGYELMLAAQNALWVLESEDASGGTASTSTTMKYCPESSSSNKNEKHSPKPSVDDEEPTTEEEEDPLDTFYKAKVNKLRLLIKAFLAARMAPQVSGWHDERREILWAYVRRLVFQHTSLMLLAQHHDSVEEFLASDLDVAALEKLWGGMHQSTHPFLCAVEDVLGTHKDGKSMRILGGDVYQTSVKDFASLPRAWYHMFSLSACVYCVRRHTCTTVEQFIELDKFYTIIRTRVHGREVDFGEHPVELAQLRLCGITPIMSEDMLKAEVVPSEVHKSKCSRSRTCSHWEENQDMSTVNLAFSLTDPNAPAFLEQCLANPEFKVMWRKGPDGPIKEPPGGICSYRHRSASSRARLRYAEWEDNTYRTSLLEESQYDLNGTHVGTCYQLAIGDTLVRPPREFVQCIVKICRSLYVPGAWQHAEVFWEALRPYMELGVLGFDERGWVSFVVGDEREGWRLLWGS